MKPETERILQLADAYADASDCRWGQDRCAIEKAVDSLVAERDTLAAGMMVAQRNLGNTLSLVPEFNEPLAVARRLTPAEPAATAEPEPADDYDLVVVTNNKTDAWRYRRWRALGETTLLRPPLTWRSAEATRDSWYGIKPGYRMFNSWAEAEKWIAGEAEPAKPSPLAEKLEAMRVMVASQRDSNGNGFTGSDDAIAAVARVVEALAKEDKR